MDRGETLTAVKLEMTDARNPDENITRRLGNTPELAHPVYGLKLKFWDRRDAKQTAERGLPLRSRLSIFYRNWNHLFLGGGLLGQSLKNRPTDARQNEKFSHRS
jgi:hypothetical protein